MFNTKYLTVSLLIVCTVCSFSELKVELVNTGNRNWFYPGEKTSFKLIVTNLSDKPIAELRNLGIKFFYEGKQLPGMDSYSGMKSMEPIPPPPIIVTNPDGTTKSVGFTPPKINWMQPNQTIEYPIGLGSFKLGNKLGKLQIEANIRCKGGLITTEKKEFEVTEDHFVWKKEYPILDGNRKLTFAVLEERERYYLVSSYIFLKGKRTGLVDHHASALLEELPESTPPEEFEAKVAIVPNNYSGFGLSYAINSLSRRFYFDGRNWYWDKEYENNPSQAGSLTEGYPSVEEWNSHKLSRKEFMEKRWGKDFQLWEIEKEPAAEKEKTEAVAEEPLLKKKPALAAQTPEEKSQQMEEENNLNLFYLTIIAVILFSGLFLMKRKTEN